MSDTMALISALSNIVPFSCCALFLYNDEAETLRCCFATGGSRNHPAVDDSHGYGLTGWVAQNWRRWSTRGRALT